MGIGIPLTGDCDDMELFESEFTGMLSMGQDRWPIEEKDNGKRYWSFVGAGFRWYGHAFRVRSGNCINDCCSRLLISGICLCHQNLFFFISFSVTGGFHDR
jgi:hypothetical protein